MNKVKLTRYINIATFILMLNALVKVITITDISKLKVSCILCIFIILIDLLRDIWDSRGVK